MRQLVGHPDGAEYYDKGLHYKVGRFGFVYAWVNGAWIRSAKTISNITNSKGSRNPR